MANRKTSSQLDGYLTVQEVARRLDISERTVVWQVAHGHMIGARKIGKGKRGIWLIPEAALSDYTPPKRGRPDIRLSSRGRK